MTLEYGNYIPPFERSDWTVGRVIVESFHFVDKQRLSPIMMLCEATYLSTESIHDKCNINNQARTRKPYEYTNTHQTFISTHINHQKQSSHV